MKRTGAGVVATMERRMDRAVADIRKTQQENSVMTTPSHLPEGVKVRGLNHPGRSPAPLRDAIESFQGALIDALGGDPGPLTLTVSRKAYKAINDEAPERMRIPSGVWQTALGDVGLEIADGS